MASNIGHRVHFSVAHESQGVLSPRSGVNNSKASSLKQCNTEHRSRLTLDFEKLASPRIRLDLNIQHRVSPRRCRRSPATSITSAWTKDASIARIARIQVQPRLSAPAFVLELYSCVMRYKSDEQPKFRQLRIYPTTGRASNRISS